MTLCQCLIANDPGQSIGGGKEKISGKKISGISMIESRLVTA